MEHSNAKMLELFLQNTNYTFVTFRTAELKEITRRTASGWKHSSTGQN